MKTDLKIFLATARKYLGYQAGALGRTGFGERVGYDSTVWSGAFVDVVARESGLHLPSFVYSPAALAEYIRRGHISRVPKPGDIAIFNFASNVGHAASAFSSPHCGIVTDVRELKTNGRFLTIEGNTTGQGPYQDKDGVHQQIRYMTDVVLFCRPEEFQSSAARISLKLLTKAWKMVTGRVPGKVELKEIEEAARAAKNIHPQMLRVGTRNRYIETVQLALSQVTDLRNCDRGRWDPVTQNAYANFQRTVGYVGSDASGIPDVNSLKRLAADTGLFQVTGD
jgi:hypothetical protein